MQPSTDLAQAKTGTEAPSRFKNASNHFVPKITESRPSQFKRCWKCNEMGHTQHTCPRTETEIYGHNQVTTGIPTAPEEKQEDKQQYTERMWNLVEQAEL